MTPDIPAIKIDQRVAILIDGNNLERSIHEITKNTKSMLNFDKLIPKLVGGRTLVRLVYFREGRNISTSLAQRLHNKFFGIVKPCLKSADIPITIEAVQLSDKIDTIILGSGDADYIELVKFLKSRGVRVEIAAVRTSAAKLLLNEADKFQFIDTDDHYALAEANTNLYKGHA